MNRLAHVFMIQRPVDKFEWPAVYGVTDNARELAEAAFGRVTPVITVDFDAEVATPEERAELIKAVADLRANYLATLEAERMSRTNALAPGMEALLDLFDGLIDGRIRL